MNSQSVTEEDNGNNTTMKQRSYASILVNRKTSPHSSSTATATTTKKQSYQPQREDDDVDSQQHSSDATASGTATTALKGAKTKESLPTSIASSSSMTMTTTTSTSPQETETETPKVTSEAEQDSNWQEEESGAKKKRRQGPRKRRRKRKKNGNHQNAYEHQLANFLQQRPDATELLQRNIIKEESVKEQMRASAAQLHKKLQSRPPLESLVKKNLIKGNAHADPTIQARQYLVQRSREMDSLSRSLKNRQSWDELHARGIIKRMSGEQKHEFVNKSQLASFLTSRPSVQSLLQARVLQTTMMWSELELGPQSSPSSTPPAARNSQSLTLVGRSLYLIGGFGNNDVTCIPHILDIDRGAWFVPALAPPMSSSPLAVDISNPTFVPAVGTRACDNGSHPLKTSNNLPTPHTFSRCGTHFAGHTISPGPWPVVLPSSRYAHSVAAMGTSLVMFGGYGEGQWLNDTWIYDTDKHSWAPAWIERLWPAFEHLKSKKQSASPPCPLPRAAHSAVAIDEVGYSFDKVPEKRLFSSMVVFGGNDRNKLFNDVWVLRPCGCPVDPQENRTWKKEDDVFPTVVSPSTYTPMKWIEPKTIGTPPTPRAGHTACLKDGSMFVFGGSEGWGTEPFNDLHILDISSVATRKSAKTNKKNTSSAFTKHEKMLMRTDVDENVTGSENLRVVWYRPSYTGTPPPPRMGHGAAFAGNNMLVFGGGDARRAFNDLHVLDISVEPMAWSRPCDTGGIPSPRAGLSATCIGTCFIIFGGGTPDGKLYGDLYVLDTDFGYYQSTTTSDDTVALTTLETSLTTTSAVESIPLMNHQNTVESSMPLSSPSAQSAMDTIGEAYGSSTSPSTKKVSYRKNSAGASPQSPQDETRRTSFKSATNSTSMLVAALDTSRGSRQSMLQSPESRISHKSFDDSSIGDVVQVGEEGESPLSSATHRRVQSSTDQVDYRAELLRLREDVVAIQKAEERQYQDLAQQLLHVATERRVETDNAIKRIDQIVVSSTTKDEQQQGVQHQQQGKQSTNNITFSEDGGNGWMW